MSRKEFKMASTTRKYRDTKKIWRNKQLETISGYAGLGMIIFIIFILGGGIYDIIEAPGAVIQTSSGAYTSLSPYPGEQTINESIVSMILYSCCFAGLLFVSTSTKVLYDRSKANLNLMIGLGLSVIGFSGAFLMLILKT
jgi:hypothetical protein